MNLGNNPEMGYDTYKEFHWSHLLKTMELQEKAYQNSQQKHIENQYVHTTKLYYLKPYKNYTRQ